MKNIIKNTLFLALIYILATYFIFAQENNSPIVYRISNIGNASATSGTLGIIDALTGKQIRDIGLPIPSRVIELSQNQRKAYIAATIGIKSNGAVLVNLTSSDDSVTPFLENKRVYRLKLAPNNDGLLWAVLGDDNQILLLDPDTLRTVKKIDNVNAPLDVIFSPDGSRAYVSLDNFNLNNNDILVFDTKTLSIVKTINLPPAVFPFDIADRVGEMAVSPDGKLLCINRNTLLSIIDTSSFEINNTVVPNQSVFGLSRLLFNPDGNTLYISERDGHNLYSFNIKTGNLSKIFSYTIDDRTGIEDLKITPDGRILYISDLHGRTILDAKDNSVVRSAVDIRSAQLFQGISLVGDFTIGQAPSLQTTAPAANQQIAANQAFSIKWQTTVMPQSYSIASHKIELSTDGGMTFNVIPGAEQLKPEAQDFTWQVPDIETTKAQIRVSTVDLGARRASSTTGNFTISRNGGGGGGDTQAPMVSFLSPKGGETFNSGDSLQISWSSSDNVGVTSQDLSLSTDGGSTFPITLANGLSGSAQSFMYQIPMSLQSNQTRLKLVVRDAAGNIAQATTPSNFSIMLGADNIPPTVTISQPTQSQSIIAGQAIQVKWQSTDNRAVASQALLLSFDNGKTFSQIATFGATDSSFTLSNIDKLSLTTPQAIVKITAVDSTGNKGEANATFTISPAITSTNYQTQNKLLTITGIGFMSNVNNNIRLFINDKEVSLTPKSVSNSSFTIKGNKKKLNITKGGNTIRLVVDGVMSNSIQFTF